MEIVSFLLFCESLRILVRLLVILLDMLLLQTFFFGCFVTIYSSLIFGEATSCRVCLAISLWIGMSSGLCSCWGVSLIFLDTYLSARRQSPAHPGLCLQKARWCIISGWVLTAAYCLMFFLLKAPTIVTATTLKSPAFKNTSFPFAVFMTVVLVVTVVLMILSFVKIKKQTDTLFQEGSHAQNVWRQRNLKRRSRIVCLFSIVTVGFIISWGPGAISIYVASLCTNSCGITEDHLKILVSFITLNPMINVIVYVIKDKKFRADVTRTIMCQVNQVAPQNNIVAMVTTPAVGTTNSARRIQPQFWILH